MLKLLWLPLLGTTFLAYLIALPLIMTMERYLLLGFGEDVDRILRASCVCIIWLGCSMPVFMRTSRKLRKFRQFNARHRCAGCGYDLRAHAPSGKCPECGTVIPQRSANPELDQP